MMTSDEQPVKITPVTAVVSPFVDERIRVAVESAPPLPADVLTRIAELVRLHDAKRE